jgi:putative addiction module component (TIGR02574 family)
MSRVLEDWKPKLAQLPRSERAELALFLLKSLDPAPEDGVEEAWNEEIRRRGAEIRNGSSIGIPVEQLFEELEKDFP